MRLNYNFKRNNNVCKSGLDSERCVCFVWVSAEDN